MHASSQYISGSWVFLFSFFFITYFIIDNFLHINEFIRHFQKSWIYEFWRSLAACLLSFTVKVNNNIHFQPVKKKSGFVISIILKTSDERVIFFVILMFDYFHSYGNSWYISVHFLENFILATDQTLLLVLCFSSIWHKARNKQKAFFK